MTMRMAKWWSARQGWAAKRGLVAWWWFDGLCDMVDSVQCLWEE